MSNLIQPIEAMAFYHPDGFVAAHRQAAQFAGEKGRIATLPDIINARLCTKPGDVPWESYFTSNSAEYVGYSRGGNPIAIVAHGIGPMSTLDGTLAAYAHQYKDKTRNRRGGRISQEDFIKLEAGIFGDVSVVDLAAVWARREYAFSGHAVTSKEISEEPLWRARLGPKWGNYCMSHAVQASKWREQRGLPDLRGDQLECTIAMDGASNCSYFNRKMLDHWLTATPGTAVAHLLSIGGLTHSHHDYQKSGYNVDREKRESLACDVSCHEWWNGTRLAAVRSDSISNIHPGLQSPQELMIKHTDRMMRSCDASERAEGFFPLKRLGEKIYTQYPKMGERMDTHEPEFLVTSMERVEGGPKLFRTTVGGYHGFFKYGVKEVERIAPNGANAYLLPSEITIEWNDGDPRHHVTAIEWYRVEIDHTRRMMRATELYNDYELLMELLVAPAS